MPCSPCFCHCSSLGITTVSSCMMIELVIYGMMPSPNTAIRVRAPPENRSMKLRNPPAPCCSSASCRIPMSTTGTGTCEPNRYTAIMNSVNRILLRRSGTLNALTKALSTGSYPTPSGDDLRPATSLLDLRPRGVRESLCADDERGRVLDAVRVREALQLGHPSRVGHLAALEPLLRVVLGQVPLRASARGLPAHAGAAAPDRAA